MKCEVDVMDPKDVYTLVQPQKQRDSISINSLSKSLKKSKNMNKSYYQ